MAAVEWLPMALLGIPSGTIAARLGPRSTIIACDAARIPIVAAVPILHWLGALDFGVLLALAFLTGVFFPAHFGSQRTILPALLGEEAEELTRGNAVLQAANRLPMVLGPALGGLLVAVLGAPGRARDRRGQLCAVGAARGDACSARNEWDGGSRGRARRALGRRSGARPRPASCAR